MTYVHIIGLLLLLIFPFQVAEARGGAAGADSALSRVLHERSSEFVPRAEDRAAGDSRKTFRNYSEMVVDALEESGDEAGAARLDRALKGEYDSSSAGLLGRMVYVYAREFYRDEIIAATSRLIQYRTFATDVPNRLNPEFIRQKEYLRELAITLGLGFRDVDGYVQEIWIGEGGESFGLMVHSDVQPVEDDTWSADPWSGEVTDSLIRGRGAIDDKGALAAIMYGMRALLDSGLPLRNKLILLVGTDEESANEDITAYLKTNPPPARTIVVDFAYPVYCAEKGWCGLWLKTAMGKDTQGAGLNLVDLQGGFSPSIVPGSATATLVPVRVDARDAGERLRELAADFERRRPGARISVAENEGKLVVTATGRSVHSSVPETGHNALMDLLVWLDRDVHPVQNPISLMARFAAGAVGLELDGRSLGIAHHDPFMGDVSVAGNMFRCDQDSILFMFNFRVPKGADLEKIRTTLESRVRDFSAEAGIGFSRQLYLSEALYNDPNSPLVNKLLNIYGDVTGEVERPRSMGGGTYARRIPDAVVFGPNLPGDEYLGHQPNESITLRALTRNIEILTHTLVMFGLD